MKSGLSVIILTFNESLHISRVVDAVRSVAERVVVVDSFSTDNTVELATAKGAEVFQNPFVNQAQQFQWAIENCDINSEWILRLDADEYIDEELCNNITHFLSTASEDCNGAILNRRHIFLGKWVRFGGRYPLPMLRLFRNGCAHIEQKWMDEHIVLDKGYAQELKGGFFDDNLNSVTWFIDKHNKYATREMLDMMLKRIEPQAESTMTKETGFKIRLKRWLKEDIYQQLPYFVRPVLYFLFRYFIQLGLLDGARGFAYHFMQGFWYRALVDLKCLEAEAALKNCKTMEEQLFMLEQLSGYQLSGRGS
ncbi:glycosyltransferase family 2 protein [Agarivorans sp. TSD2052]|uniref:glycosyltransferase family 2 protein n=1 Tax=Agarivorans sp. TSD2052 TaxID=2937286 RepID=UPI002010727B|nr:glycosyltransferase family 2 protein [Agarivorans sp. TSD2052]UPW18266.1 glycosyltransferase family 2 protein [Agarivorans sp. TSD2052]